MGEAMKAAKPAKSTGSLAAAQRVLRIEADAIAGLIERLDERFERVVEMIFECRGRVVVTGMGKSGLIGRKISATLASTGTPSVFLHAAEALHGDLGMLMREDVALAVSQSGETEEMIALLERRGFREEDFAALHPAGKLGTKLRRVDSVMHAGEALPRVGPQASIPEVIYEISRKKLGMVVVTDDAGKLLGIVTDGDLRRLMERRKKEALDLTAADSMTKNPVTLARTELAASALRLMEERKIPSVVVVDAERRVEGVVHLHDLWTLQLF